MMARYQVDKEQAEHVAVTAVQLLRQCAPAWKIDQPFFEPLLRWAACLHEIGLDISHDGYQRHGAYIAENADMPGFPRAEQRLLAYLIENQRRQFATRLKSSLPRGWRRSAMRLAILLRLAVLLNRSRNSLDSSALRIDVDKALIKLEFDPVWLAENPLTVADLEREQEYLASTKYRLSY